MESPHLVDINEAARLTGLSHSTIYRLARQRRLRSFKVLTALRFDRADLMALVRENTATAPTRVEEPRGPR